MDAQNYIEYLIAKNATPTQVPEGYTSKDLVVKALTFDNPPRMPFQFTTQPSDIAEVFNVNSFHPVDKPTGLGETYVDEWGVTWEVTGNVWDHAIDGPLKNTTDLSEYTFPKYNFGTADPVTSALISTAREAGKYVLGINTINMFEHLRSLLGFEEHMMAPYTRPEFLKELVNKLVDLTLELIDGYELNGGLDGFMTIEDWGLQKGLQIDIKHFHEFYKPAYKRIIDHCHSKGIHFFWHCCGDIITLLPEMVELGVDAVQLDQPMLMGYENIIKATQGKLCCFNTVDIQWSVAENLTKEELEAETKAMVDTYKEKQPHGGFIMRHYPQPREIDLSEEREKIIANTFLENCEY